MSLLSIGALVGMGGGVIYGGWASEQFGWRLALVSVGLPGLVLALVFLFTVDELPRRPADAPGVDEFTGKSLGGVSNSVTDAVAPGFKGGNVALVARVSQFAPVGSSTLSSPVACPPVFVIVNSTTV